MQFTLERNSWKHLVLTDATGRQFTGVEPIRAFPLSDPRRAISIVDVDGKEILYIDSIDDVPQDTRRILEEELAQREFVPLVLHILNTPLDSEPAEWHVETDRGPTTFQLNGSDNVHRKGEAQISIVDANGIRYLIPDVNKLDEHSRSVLERFF